jgi:phospholipase/carboxylesterase
MSQDNLLECVEILTGPNPTHSVVWLHGLGADGNDFAPIVPELRLPKSLAVRFIFPHAPVQPVTINGGMAMRAWYDILVPNLVRIEDEQGIRKSEQDIDALIQREVARGIPTENIVLAGFSQGCAMTLHTGIRATYKLAGLMALSGYLPLIDMADQERQAANAKTPIFMAHGSFDPVVALERAEASHQKFVALGYTVQWHAYPMQHSVCPEEIHDMAGFLSTVLV